MHFILYLYVIYIWIFKEIFTVLNEEKIYIYLMYRRIVLVERVPI